MAEHDRDRIARLIDAVADRAVVDWERESGASDAGTKRKIRNLRVVQQVERVHSSTPEPLEALDPTVELGGEPESWGPLRIVALIDRGAYGRVYRARDEALQIDVALKLLAPLSPPRDATDERFLDEARKLARVRHPNVLTVHGVAVHDGVVGLWTELLEGMTLERCLAVQGTFSAQEATLVGIDLCRALAAVHAAGLVHRDVKTKNVMREKGGRIVLLDFSAGSEQASSSGSAAGTPLYMAPELFRGGEAAAVVDIYALGVVLFRLVTGRFPIEASGLDALRAAHNAGAVTRLLDVRPDLPAGFVRIIERALDPDPARRFQSAGAMEAELAKLSGGAPGEAVSAFRPSVRASPRLLGAVAVVLVACAALAIWAVRSGTRAFDVEAAWLLVRDGRSNTIEPGSELRAGDCLRLRLSGNRAMHVYVFNEDAHGTGTVLFPLEGLDLRNPLKVGRDHRIPGTVAGREECWRLGEGGGAETMLVVASRDALAGLEHEIAAMPRAGASERTIPQGDWARRLRGVTGLGSVEDSGASLSDLSRMLSGEVARKAGIWVFEARFPSGAADGAARDSRSSLESDVERLERLLLDDPASVALQVELARTLLRRTSPREFGQSVRALELALTAFESDPQDLGACETRAVALERVYLRESAFDAWGACAALDGDANFRERVEAGLQRARGQDLAESKSPASLAAARHAEDDLLPQWAEQVLRGNSAEASATFETLESIGATLLAETGDRFLADSVAAIRRAGNSRNASRLKVLAEAHRTHAQAVTRRRSGDPVEALRLLADAEAGFAEAESAHVMGAQYNRAVCDYLASRFGEAEAMLARLREVARPAGYRSLLGEIHWMEGLSRARRSNLSESLPHFGAAAEIFAAIGDESRGAAVENLLAEHEDRLGDYAQGWQHRRSALSRLDRIDDPRRSHQLRLSAAKASSAQGWLRAAVEFERTGLASARERRDLVEMVSGGSHLADFLQQLDRGPEAEELLAEIRGQLTSFPETARDQPDAELAVAEAKLLLASTPDRAAAALDRAIRYYENGRQFRLAELYPLRGHALLRAGRIDAAERDLRAGIEFYEGLRDDVVEPIDGITLSDVARRVYDEMIRFQIEARGSPDLALEFAERGRARLLVRHAGAEDAAQREDWGGLAPRAVAWIYYVLLDDRLLIWTGRAGKIDYVERPVDARRLAASVRELTRRLERGDATEYALPALHDLYDLLIAPATEALAGASTLLVLPDKTLHRVPFAALADRATGRHLVETFEIAVLPALALLPGAIDTIQRDHPRDAPATSDALVVGNPRPSASDRFGLGSLAGAEAEAREIEGLYDSALLLLGEAATPSRFLAALSRHDVVHFAGHAVSSDFDPLLSRLLLAPEASNQESGDLLAGRLYDLDLDRVRLVVLAACETAGGHVSAAEGPIGLARPFLASGVPSVVATLWRVEDDASRELFVRFHQAYRASGNPLRALNEAQRAALAAGPESRLSTWAAVQVYVGGVPDERRRAAWVPSRSSSWG